MKTESLPVASSSSSSRTRLVLSLVVAKLLLLLVIIMQLCDGCGALFVQRCQAFALLSPITTGSIPARRAGRRGQQHHGTRRTMSRRAIATDAEQQQSLKKEEPDQQVGDTTKNSVSRSFESHKGPETIIPPPSSSSTTTSTSTTATETTATETTIDGGSGGSVNAGRTFPMGLVVDHNPIKQALLIASTSQDCSVIISGRRGTCKSVLARSVRNLLPPFLERIKNSPFNIDPKGHVIDTFLAQQLQESGQTLSELETDHIETPFVTVPLGVMEDALVGQVDLEQSLETGQTVFSPGLLAKAHRGVLYIDEVNLLDEEVASLLFQCLADGFVSVEREGLSVRYPCQPLVIATYNPAEGEVREHLLDRFAIQLSADDNMLTTLERVQVVRNVEAFAGAETTSPSSQEDARRLLEQAQQEQKQLSKAVFDARSTINQVEMTSDQLLYLCETATRAGCEGQRAEIFASKVAKASAALGGRKHVLAKDLELGVLLAVAPRARFMLGAMAPPDDESGEEQQDATEQAADDDESKPRQQAPPPPMAPQPDWDNMFQDNEPPEEQEQEEEDADDERMQDQSKPDEDEEEGQQEEMPEEELRIPLEFMFGVDSTPIDPRLLVFAKRTRQGKSGKRSRKYNIDRGRFVRALFPRGANRGHLAVGATLRAAAPYQTRRRRRLQKNGDRRSVFVTKDDFRIKQMKKKTGSLIVFVVDASGSMALNRMSAAKGAAMSLLNEAYKSRDKVALIAFHGESATVVVPPTKSMALATRRLEAMPCGSKTPLGSALEVAMRTGLNTIKVKKDAGRVIIVLISDGRANVPLCVSHGEPFDPSIDPKPSDDGVPSRDFLKDEVLAIAKQIGIVEDFDMLVIDTEDKFVSTGVAEEIARAARGNYYHLARTDSKGVSRAVQAAVKQ